MKLDRELIERFLRLDHLAVVGVSRDSKQLANAIARQLRAGGRTVYGVNEAAGGATIDGEPSYVSLAEVPQPVEGVIIAVAEERAADAVRTALDAGVTRIWLHRGVGKHSVSPEAVALAREAGAELVAGACPLMFDEPVRGVHRIHRVLARANR